MDNAEIDARIVQAVLAADLATLGGCAVSVKAVAHTALHGRPDFYTLEVRVCGGTFRPGQPRKHKAAMDLLAHAASLVDTHTELR